VLGVRIDVVEHLRGKELLLLLDNVEHLLAAAPELAELLASAGGLHLLITSRAPLRISGEHEYRLEPLRTSDAVTLFLERARRAGADLEPGKTIEAICDRLDGLPLAVELAAPRTRLLDPETLLQRLEHALPLLTSGARDAPERQRTLRATMEWSFNLLEEGPKRLFARLAVFVGSFSLEAADEVANADLDSLGALVELSLLKPIGESRFLMLETIREFAVERLEETGEGEKLRKRHAEHFVRVAEALGGKHIIAHKGQPERIARLAGENDDFRAVAEWSLAHGRADLVLRLGHALWRFWSIRGHVAEGRQWLDSALAQSARDLPERFGGLLALGELVRFEGDLARSRALKEELLAELPQRGEMSWVRPGVLADLGDIAMMLGDYERARRLLEESLALRSDPNPDARMGLSRTLASLGDLALYYENDLVRAESLFRESRRRSSEGDPESSQTGWSTQRLAKTMLRKGDHAEAAHFFAEALRIFHKLRDQGSAAGCLEDLALVAAAEGQTDRAARLRKMSEGLREDSAIELDAAVDYALSSID
jgi:predicted ATPase